MQGAIIGLAVLQQYFLKRQPVDVLQESDSLNTHLLTLHAERREHEGMYAMVLL